MAERQLRTVRPKVHLATGRVQLLLESDSEEPSESKSVDSMSNPCWWRPGSEYRGTDTIMGTEVV